MNMLIVAYSYLGLTEERYIATVGSLLCLMLDKKAFSE